MTLNDELGQVHFSLGSEFLQIKYLFSDKTGTITANMMEFKKLYVYDREYGKSMNDTEVRKSQASVRMDFDFLLTIRLLFE